MNATFLLNQQLSLRDEIFGEKPKLNSCKIFFLFKVNSLSFHFRRLRNIILFSRHSAYLLKDFYEEILKQMRKMRRILATQPTTNMLDHAPAKNQVLAEKICFKFHPTTLMPVRVHVLYCII